ncbi:MAG: hypothetical protein QM760_07465 [Nibricoccus sp.]
MILIWHGLGLIIPMIVGAVFIAVVYAVDAYMKNDSYCSVHYWPKVAALLVSAVIVWFLGRFIRNKKFCIGKDAKGKKIYAVQRHALYYLAFEYWAFVLIALSIVCYWI